MRSTERVHFFKYFTFAENFESAEVEVDIVAGVEITITNPFRNSGRIPAKWIIVDDRGLGILKRGLATWTIDSLSFLNASSTDSVDATVLFLR